MLVSVSGPTYLGPRRTTALKIISAKNAPDIRSHMIQVAVTSSLVAFLLVSY